MWAHRLSGRDDKSAAIRYDSPLPHAKAPFECPLSASRVEKDTRSRRWMKGSCLKGASGATAWAGSSTLGATIYSTPYVMNVGPGHFSSGTRWYSHTGYAFAVDRRCLKLDHLIRSTERRLSCNHSLAQLWQWRCAS